MKDKLFYSKSYSFGVENAGTEYLLSVALVLYAFLSLFLAWLCAVNYLLCWRLLGTVLPAETKTAQNRSKSMNFQ